MLKNGVIPGPCEAVGASQENPLHFGVMENTNLIKNFFDLLMPLLTQTTYNLNRTCYKIGWVSFDSIFVSQNMDTAQTETEVFLIVLDTNAFNSFKYLINSAWIETADSFLISKAPEKFETSMYTFIDCEQQVQIMLLGFVVFLILATSLMYYLLENDVDFSYLRLFARHVWKVISPLVDQPMLETNSPKAISLNLIQGTWLLATMVIGIYITSCLKSKLSMLNYDYIDSLSDLVRAKNMQPVTLKYLSEHVHIIKMAATDKVAKKVLDKLNNGDNLLIDFFSLLLGETLYPDIQKGKKALLINKVFWQCIFHVASASLVDDVKLYFGKESISSGVMTFYYNNTFSKSDQEIVNIQLLNIVETQIMDHFMHRNRFTMNKFIWVRDQTEEVTPTTFKDLNALFLITHSAYLIFSIVLTFEIYLNYIAKKAKKNPGVDRMNYRIHISDIFDQN